MGPGTARLGLIRVRVGSERVRVGSETGGDSEVCGLNLFDGVRVGAGAAVSCRFTRIGGGAVNGARDGPTRTDSG